MCVSQCEKEKIIPHRNVTTPQFKSLLKLAVKELVFVLNDNLRKQIGGIAMRSPLGPTIANALLRFNEKQRLSDCRKDFRHIMYKGYVDDCILLFGDISHVDLFHKCLNTKHRNIKFTVEREGDGSLPFLDVKLTKMVTNVFRKDTFTSLGLNFFFLLCCIFI